MINFGVTAEKQKKLLDKMLTLNIKEEDIIENFIRSSGPGGQNVNKTSTCVYLKHIPTGIEVKCGQNRSQAINRFIARQILADKIESAVMGRLSEERQRIEKIRRQKRKRSKRSKQKMLNDKRIQSKKKSFRAPIKSEDM